MIEKPLYQNPLGGGPATLVPNPGAGTSPRGGADMFGVSNANFNVSPPGTLKVDPQATLNMLGSNITAPGQIPDRYKEGFADFYNQNPDDYMRIGGQAISYVTTPQGETIRFGDTGGASNFRRYLESIGETPRADSVSFAQESTNPIEPDNNAFPASPVDPLQSLSPLETNPYNRVGQQLTGPNQVGDFNSRLNKIEQGIMSLLRNRGQGFNRGYQPNYGFNMGFGYSFPPFGGMYG